MSSGASSQSFFRAPIDRDDLTGDQKDHPPTYDQVNPPFKGQSGKPGLFEENEENMLSARSDYRIIIILIRWDAKSVVLYLVEVYRTDVLWLLYEFDPAL